MFNEVKTKLANNALLIEAALSEYFSGSIESPKLSVAQKYSLLGGGKRIRATLTIEICRILGGNSRAALPYACAIEMIHASSLVHDDMPCMDNDDYRRGKPATHKEFGDTAALLAGDALMIKAFEVIAANDFLSPDANLAAVKILAESCGDCGMLGGQAIDTLSSNYTQTLDELVHLHKLKTGKLISASAKLGCLAAGIGIYDERFICAAKYAENIGLAFQIVDDLIEHKEGKSEKNSFLTFMSDIEAEKYALDLTNEAIKSIELVDDGALRDLAKYLIVREF